MNALPSTAYMTRITSQTYYSLGSGDMLFTVAKVTDPMPDYEMVAPLNSLVITLIENQTSSSLYISIGDFQYGYLLSPNSPLYYKDYHSSESGPYYLRMCDSSNNVLSTTFDLQGGDYFSTVLIVAPGKYTFGPLD